MCVCVCVCECVVGLSCFIPVGYVKALTSVLIHLDASSTRSTHTRK